MANKQNFCHICVGFSSGWSETKGNLCVEHHKHINYSKKFPQKKITSYFQFFLHIKIKHANKNNISLYQYCKDKKMENIDFFVLKSCFLNFVINFVFFILQHRSV
ncbi:hypothetical protein B566_EDAN001691 [Ephemera danica]|nr:hypothetical protein B566_EDAN001691 [Ephemera danica]